MKQKLLLLTLLISGAVFAQISVGIRIGPPPQPRIVRVRPASPGPGYIFTDGYWYPVRGHYKWHEAYWTRPPYEGAAWVPPHHDGQYYLAGHWDGPHGRIEHDHHSDHDHNRDYHREGDHR